MDTADVYHNGKSEEVVGRGIKATRDHWVVATKFVNSHDKGPNLGGHSRKWVIQTVENSLRRLGTDYAGRGLGAAFTRQELTPEALSVLGAVEQADALIVTTPVYNGSYAGLFKHLFDLIDPLALVDRPVLIGATGGGQRHALVVEHQLRPLFGFYSALTVPSAVYGSDSDFSDGKLTDPQVLARAGQAVDQFATLVSARQPKRQQVSLASA
ncbi:NAD(P)H-dependent oxidoreductase [Mesorhizobium sp. M0296]